VPAADLAESVTETGSSAVALSSIYALDAESLAAEIATLRALLPAGVAILIGGRGAASLDAAAAAPDHVRLTGLGELRGWLRVGSRAVAT
jgi:hypothetical protein